MRSSDIPTVPPARPRPSSARPRPRLPLAERIALFGYGMIFLEQIYFLRLAFGLAARHYPVSWWIWAFDIGNLMLTAWTGVLWLLRQPAKAEARSIRDIAVPFLVTFFWPATSPLLAAQWPPAPVQVLTGALLFGAGFAVAAWGIWSLRGAFSVTVAASNRLVTCGPYRWVRHPIYSAYLLMVVGQTLAFPGVPRFVLFFLWTAALVGRARMEERALEKTFPEYARYRERTGMLVPRIRFNKQMR